MSCRKSLSLRSITIVLVLAAAGCARRQKPTVERLAIVPLDNLSSDTNLNWAGRAIASALAYDLAPAPNLHVQMVDSVSGAYAIQAPRVLEGYFAERNGRLEMVATLEDLQRTKTVDLFELSGPASEGVLPLLNRLAKRLSPPARPFGTSKLEAFRAYGEALSSRDAETALRGLESASEADPHFAAANIARAQVLLRQGQREQALKILAAVRAANPDAIDSAEVDYLTASVTGDVGARAKALETLTRLTPADASRFRELGDLRLAQRQFQEAARNFEAAGRLAPENPEIWNQLGYAYAYAQDLANAQGALKHYGQMLAPTNSNALDSLGEVHFFLGDFASASKYFLEAYEKNPARPGEELVKAAETRMMAGDRMGADGIFQKYLGLAQPAQRKSAGYEQAQWEFLTGRRKSGMARLELLIPSLEADQKSLALSQLSIWKMETGSANAAAELAAQAEALAREPRTRNLSVMCRVIAGMPAINSGSRVVDAYALLFARKYADAVPLLEAIYRETSPTSDGQIRTLLAWAYLETRRVADARKLLQIYPIPLSSGDPVFVSLMFPRFLYLRMAVLQNEGKGAEAKRSYELFRQYAGDVPDIFGVNRGFTG